MSPHSHVSIFSWGAQEKTLKKTVCFEGIALHSGEKITMVLHPGPSGSGIVFERTDVDNGQIPATYKYVQERPFCTIIQNKHGVEVSTIEHLMAALFALSIDNVRICLNGPEVPVLDGSSLPFYTRLEEAGAIEQSSARRILRVLKDVKVETTWGFAQLSPLPSFTLECEMTFAGRTTMPPQQRAYRWFEDAFKTEIASARTFGFFEDIEALQHAGFAKGGSLDNAVVVKDGVPLNPEGLRFSDECVRHKILDAIGDLYLAGMPILGKYTARNGGHTLNNRLLHALFADDANHRIETLQPENQNQWQPFTRSIMMGFTTSHLF